MLRIVKERFDEFEVHDNQHMFVEMENLDKARKERKV